jgi:hypothetical protein
MVRALQPVARAVRRRGGEAALGTERLELELAADRARRARVSRTPPACWRTPVGRYSNREGPADRQFSARARELEAIAARFEGAADLTRARRDHPNYETQREKRGIRCPTPPPSATATPPVPGIR